MLYPVEGGGKGWESGEVTRVAGSARVGWKFYVCYDGTSEEYPDAVDCDVNEWKLVAIGGVRKPGRIHGIYKVLGSPLSVDPYLV